MMSYMYSTVLVPDSTARVYIPDIFNGIVSLAMTLRARPVTGNNNSFASIVLFCECYASVQILFHVQLSPKRYDAS